MEQISFERQVLTPANTAKFWSYVPVKPEVGCWQWGGEIHRNGSLAVSFGRNAQRLQARRCAWVLAGGVLTPSSRIKPLCTHENLQFLCVRPSHLTDETAKNRRYMQFRVFDLFLEGCAERDGKRLWDEEFREKWIQEWKEMEHKPVVNNRLPLGDFEALVVRC